LTRQYFLSFFGKGKIRCGFAAPVAAGVTALLLQKCPAATSAGIEVALMVGAGKLPLWVNCSLDFS